MLKSILIICLAALYPAIGWCDVATTTVIDTRSLLEKLMSARPLVSPSSSVATPVAYGVDWGTLILGVAGQTGTQFTGRPFGEYAAGLGLGNADKYVSLTSIVSSGGLDEVVRDGNLNFQLSRNLTPRGTALAVGVENVAPWGADTRNKMNFYVVTSTLFTLHPREDYFLNIVTSVGLGNNRFVHNYQTSSTNEADVHTVRPFASVGIQILPQAALIMDYVGLTINAGMSIVPFQSIPLAASLTALDLTNRGGNHIPLAGSIGYAYTFI